MNIVCPDWPAPKNVKSMVSLRTGGYSAAPYTSFNLAAHVGDEPHAIARNRARLTELCAQRFGYAPNFHWLNQVHGSRSVEVFNQPSPAVSVDAKEDADAAYTRAHRAACVVLTADCLPLLLTDLAGTEVAAIHAGWRGLVAGVITSTLSRFRARPEDVLAYLGPAISVSAFQVGREVRQCFFDASRFGSPSSLEKTFVKDPDNKDKYYADLYALARLELQSIGVQNIYGGAACTYRQNNAFYSYRKEGQTGRFASAIWIE